MVVVWQEQNNIKLDFYPIALSKGIASKMQTGFGSSGCIWQTQFIFTITKLRVSAYGECDRLLTGGLIIRHRPLRPGRVPSFVLGIAHNKSWLGAGSRAFILAPTLVAAKFALS